MIARMRPMLLLDRSKEVNMVLRRREVMVVSLGVRRLEDMRLRLVLHPLVTARVDMDSSTLLNNRAAMVGRTGPRVEILGTNQ
jgi:hypothetical protein